MNRYHWKWFYYHIRKEAECFKGVELQFIYCGVIVTDVMGRKRAEFVDGDFLKLFNTVLTYLCNNYARRKYIIHIKKGGVK